MVFHHSLAAPPLLGTESCKHKKCIPTQYNGPMGASSTQKMTYTVTVAKKPCAGVFSAEQATLLRSAETGSGTAVSFTVTLMVSESEQYLTLDTSTPSGRQSEESSKEMSCPDLVRLFPVHEKLMIPSPLKSKWPALSAKSFRTTVTVSVRPSAPPLPW